MSNDSAPTDADRAFLEPDALAGVVDMFTVLGREELADAAAELAFKRGESIDRDAVERAIDDAISEFALVSVEREQTNGADQDPHRRLSRLAVGPTAFPRLPDGAADLPHILEIDGNRAIDREAVATAVEERLRRDAARAAADGDDDRLETLLDVCFDVDVWAGVDTDDVRADIERALE
ncbi:Uncharacterized protein AArcCO_0370 [Halalkaliarchaeum sp. AArc-CO]|uniref:DUF7109 family protein n=2 Tax=unclassified Halalkaliarchaeum TaxID=2678344 RepID=UPI00217D9C49|nr:MULTISPECIES: hypothetical protein [unclassified Halalkaliarchaeum]MDR5673356.1 hypothetical protein [Halalkaliarchaeum sp. AArc-GB]UWG49696.1 Uncharacterized protein AArcCO_0370 [Halalkaliarchaeum sp. AArc-CO]